jgi:hypothetical protein
VGLHLACSPKTCLLVYSYKKTSLADGIFDRVPLVLHNFFCLSNLAAFIVLKVTKQVTSAHIVQKSAVARSSFHVPGFFASVLISSTCYVTLMVYF